RWKPSRARDAILVTCRGRDCLLADDDTPLPVWTVDDDIYRETPSLLVATSDKFAQIVRNEKAGRLLGVDTEFDSPDLVLQDELHLVSRPLGTLAGFYEIAIDEICGFRGLRPKVIGSTATIRRAAPQVRALFDRDTRQFPPMGLDESDSGFAVRDEERPGRLYLGVTTAGRSAKFTLQAVASSLLQAATDRA